MTAVLVNKCRLLLALAIKRHCLLMKVLLYLWSIRSRSEYVAGTEIREECSVYRKV